MRLICLVLGSILGLHSAGFAQESKRMQRLLPFFKGEASAYQVKTAQGDVCEPTSEPIQSWKAGEYYGAVFVWTGPQRPELIGCMLVHATDGKYEVMHELQSLSTAALPEINVRDVRLFAPQEPGVKFLEVGSAIEVAANRTLRLRQMRGLARQSEMTITGDSTVKLRLLPTPIYRYPGSSEGDVIDGGIFAFVGSLGTDPEGLCIVEAIRKGDGSESWRIGFARFTWRSLEAGFRNEAVWAVDQDHGFWDGRRVNSTYLSGTVTTLGEDEIYKQDTATAK